MAVLLIRHRVRRYDAWKAVFDEDAAARQAYGARDERVFRSVADADEVLVCLAWDDPERARLFVRSDDLREAMVRAAVADRPDVWLLGEASDPWSDA
jgi:hypothetical protein